MPGTCQRVPLMHRHGPSTPLSSSEAPAAPPLPPRCHCQHCASTGEQVKRTGEAGGGQLLAPSLALDGRLPRGTLCHVAGHNNNKD